MTQSRTRAAGPLAFCILLSSACSDLPPDDGPGGSFSRHVITHQGLEREYFVYLPAGYDGSRDHPVVFFLHGYGGSATGTEAETTNGLNRYAEEYGYVVVYPQGTWFMSGGPSGQARHVSSWNHVSGNFDDGPEGPLCTADAERFPCPPECGDCGRCGWISCNDDVGFLDALLETVTENFAADPERLYLTGFSAGSMMANHFGCAASQWFAAVALVAGRLERGYRCAPTGPLPLMQVNGARDDVVPHDGRVSRSGFFYATTGTVAAAWAKGSGCNERPEPWSSAWSDAHGLVCTASCAGTDRESVDCLWPDGAHYWPGYPVGHGSYGYCVTALQQKSMPRQTPCVQPDTGVDVWGSRLVFDFFATH